MNQKNSLGLNSCFLDLNDPIELFKIWMNEAKKTEPNDPNALALATAGKKGIPSVRMILLKDFILYSVKVFIMHFSIFLISFLTSFLRLFRFRTK